MQDLMRASFTRLVRFLHSRIRYDTRCYFNVRSKADISQLNLPHVWTYCGSVERFRYQNLLWRAANHAGRHEDYLARPTNVLIAYRALIVHKNTVGGEIWCSFLSIHAFCSAMDRHMQHAVFHTIAFLAFSCLAFSASPSHDVVHC